MPANLPPLPDQADRLVSLGVHEIAGLSADDVRSFATGDPADGSLLALHSVPASRLAPLLRLAGKPGFVVEDMSDVDEFTPIDGLVLPEGPGYLLHDVDRGDQMTNWSPDEALPSITAAGRTPLTLAEGILWLLQQPEALQRRHCFMTIGSRLRKANGRLDSRTPALWISNGTGRDGRTNRDAPKVGWCWAGNRHTWLGFASAAARVPTNGARVRSDRTDVPFAGKR